MSTNYVYITITNIYCLISGLTVKVTLFWQMRTNDLYSKEFREYKADSLEQRTKISLLPQKLYLHSASVSGRSVILHVATYCWSVIYAFVFTVLEEFYWLESKCYWIGYKERSPAACLTQGTIVLTVCTWVSPVWKNPEEHANCKNKNLNIDNILPVSRKSLL